MTYSREAIAQEILRRKLATEKLVEFAKFVNPNYIDEPIHHLIGSYLDRVMSGEIKRLIINTPPQVGKSALVSNCLPAFWLGRKPDDELILTSYGAALAEFHSQRARDIIDSQAYRQLFPKTVLRGDTRAREFWRIADYRGSLLASGVGGPITGHGVSGAALIDDPVGTDEQAHSEVALDKIWQWYLSGFRSRVRPESAIIICQTRWSEGDLTGRILNDAEVSKEGWVVLRIPALTETQEERDYNNRKLNLPIGESDPLGRTEEVSCSPVRWPTETYRTIRAGSLLTWICLYQNAPIGIQGVVIQRDMFSYEMVAPPCSAYLRYFDKAGTEGGGKYTAGVLLGYERAPNGIGGRIHVIDVVRGQWSAATREPIIKAVVENDRRLYGMAVQTWFEQEPGSGGKESAESTIKNLMGFAVFCETVSGDKMTRAQPFVSQLMGRNVSLVIGEWNQAYIDEWVSIPNGKYTDQVDASSGALAHAVDIAPASQPSVSGERVQLSDAMKQLPSAFFRGIARGGAIARYVNNRYVTVKPQADATPFGFAPRAKD